MSDKVRKALVLIIALMSYFLNALDNSLVLTSLAKIQNELAFNQVALSWMQDAYGLAFGSFILLSGKLSDMYGRRKMMNIALVLFMLGSLTTGLSSIQILTIIARFVEGIGAAILTPTSLALLMDYFEGEERNRAIAWYTSIAGIGMSIGLVLGGTLASFLTWRLGFVINACVSLILFILSLITLRKKEGKGNSKKLDFWGAVFSIVGTGLVVYGVNGASHIWPFVISGFILLIIFVLGERRAADPLMPLFLFKNKKRCFAYLSRAFLVADAMGYYFFDTQYLQEYLHFSPLLAGIAYLPMTLTLFATAMIVSSLVNRIGNERILFLGGLAVLLAFIWAVIVKDNNYVITILGPEILLGLGQGLALAPQTNLGIYQVESAHAGSASGTINVFHQIGGVLGIAFMTQFGISVLKVQTLALRYNGAMWVGLIIAVALVITTLCELNSHN